MIYSQEEMKKRLVGKSLKTPVVNMVNDSEYEASISSMKNMMAKFEKIADKQKCARVRFLDWLAVKILHYGTTWSRAVQKLADKIDSPCVIKLK